MGRIKGILREISALSWDAALDYLIWGNRSMTPFFPQAEEDAKGEKMSVKEARNVRSVRGKLSALLHDILEYITQSGKKFVWYSSQLSGKQQVS